MLETGACTFTCAFVEAATGSLLRAGKHLLAGLSLAVLASCGGGGGAGNDPPAPPPVATAAADNFTVAWNGERRLAVADNDITSGGTPVLSVSVAPKNGSVSITAGAMSYTPKPGFFGADEFSYKLDVGNTSSTALVKLVVEAEFALQGVVTDGPIANAKVQAGVGSKTFAVDADALGRYSLPIKSSNPSDFVTLTGTGVGAQSKLVLTSLAGEVSGLAALTKDGKLTSEQAPALVVSHVSAALAGLMVQAGKLPTNNAELGAAALKLNSLAVSDAAALVKLVVDAGVALPTGAGNTRELLESTVLLRSFDAAQRLDNPKRLAAIRAEAVSDSTLAVTPPLPVASPIELLYANGTGGAAVTITSVTLRPDGTATVLDDEVRSAKWKVQNKVLGLTLDTPIVQTDFSEEEVLYDLVTTGYLFSDVGAVGSGQFALSAYKQLSYRQYKNGPFAGTQVDDSSGDFARRYTANALPFKATDFSAGTRIAGPFSDRRPNPPFSIFKQDVLRITGVGTGTVERTGATVAWRLVDGALRVDIGNFSARYRKLGEGPLGEERWTFEPLDAAGQAVDISEIMAVRVSPITLTAGDWAKAWHGNINDGVGERVTYNLKANGSWTLAGAARGELDPTQLSTRYWRQLPDGRLDMVSGTAQCNPFLGDPACKVTQNRFWTVLGRTGKTLWVLEEGPYLSSAAAASWRFVALTDTSSGP
jgi:Bacterial Ig domain